MANQLSKIILFLLNYIQIFRFFAFLNRNKTIILMYHSITDRPEEEKKHYLGLHLD